MKFVRGQGTAQNTQGEASSQDDRDVFMKSEKWLPPLPKCEHGSWKTGRVQPRTPSSKRAVEEMARNDAAARGSVPVRAEVAKAAPAETTEVVTPVSEEGHGDAPGLVAVPGQGRLSAVTVHGPPVTSGVTSQAPTPTSPAGDSALGEGTAAPGSTHWSSAPIVSPSPAPMASGSETEVCVACQGSGLLNPQVNLRLFRLIGSATLRTSAIHPSRAEDTDWTSSS